MRNWNGSNPCSFSFFCKSFEPTYEELKPTTASTGALTASEFWAYLWGIETPLVLEARVIEIQVLSLPMRNWNRVWYRPLWRGDVVLSLPMRNWNRLQQDMFCTFHYVLSLPMRNWNGADVLMIPGNMMPFWAYLWGIETDTLQSNVSVHQLFWAYLWGIETGEVGGFAGLGAGRFEPTYEELKPLFANCWAIVKTGFEPTYEELKR